MKKQVKPTKLALAKTTLRTLSETVLAREVRGGIIISIPNGDCPQVSDPGI